MDLTEEIYAAIRKVAGEKTFDDTIKALETILFHLNMQKKDSIGLAKAAQEGMHTFERPGERK